MKKQHSSIKTFFHKSKLILVFLITLTCCTRSSDPLRKFFGSYRNYFEANGKIKGDRYYDPFDRFSIQIPNLVTPGRIINGKLMKDGGTIGFMDDFGYLVRIDVATALEDKTRATFNSQNSKLILPALREYFLNLYKETAPDSKIIYQEYGKWNNIETDLFIVELKKGEMFTDSSNKRENEIRTSIGFIHGNSFYLLSSQPSLLTKYSKDPKIGIEERIKSVKSLLDTIILY